MHSNEKNGFTQHKEEEMILCALFKAEQQARNFPSPTVLLKSTKLENL